jgi:sodium-dependent dicarboxylate transporter 2/3/5
MWGGLSLGVALQESGLASYLAQADFASTIPQSWGLALFTVVVSMLMSTFMSNTATAALLVPMALALPAPENREVAMLAALACSFGMALPISTPPNLVVYSTGTITSQEMRRSGAIVAVAGAVLLLLGFRIMLPLAF